MKIIDIKASFYYNPRTNIFFNILKTLQCFGYLEDKTGKIY